MDDVVVIGGGAAGMIAAWRAASLGARTRLLEKNNRLGLKIRISGGGKCNITHGGDMESLRRAFAPNEARFLRPAFRRFTNEDVLDLLRARSVTVHTRPDGRVFPDSGRADDVTDALDWHMRQAGGQVELGVPVTDIAPASHHFIVRAGTRTYASQAVVIAVGGASYPKTGTTGDGYAWVRSLGHTLVPLRAGLAPIYLEEGRRSEYSGVALRDCLLRARQAGRELARWRGDLLFTHQGVSGPAVLAVSRAAAIGMEEGPVTLDADLLPDLPPDELSSRIAAAQAGGGRRSIRALLAPWLPDRLVPEALERSGIEPDTPLHQLPRKARNRLVETVKRWDLGQVAAIPLERGEVTAGGVSLDEVDPATMASRIVSGLFLCGEILDVAGPVGGYNLQAAFSTGYVAGESAARFAEGAALVGLG